VADLPVPEGNLIVECDEMWSFVGAKDRKYWVWLAIDQTPGPTKGRIVGCAVGDRSSEGAQALWQSLPTPYQERADFYTDFWDPYAAVFPQDRHYPVAKDSGYTNHIERFNGTFRARISRLVRKSYAFSKSLQNHTAAIWNFIHHYNQQFPSLA
jgi:IS1 family transposase